jgi:hypothetical protein
VAQARRIYAVSKDGQVVALVNAISPAQAAGFVARSQYTAAVASQGQLIALTKDGMDVQQVSEPAPAAE